ncbi:hypothetical protein SAMN05446037_100684 [Anaerovirgula multivorans]|uniref:Haemolysin XhlA n=1 Tax=Anaerovirgula multivorans TaxID=312168 RepID=A0A239CQ66_9FIRM|nr:hypothetical protein [Anaerovirgula multivorans]SNS22059.1 hypothetical protein SAMN05446037_100684 [Anaerovirgula multivorans]
MSEGLENRVEQLEKRVYRQAESLSDIRTDVAVVRTTVESMSQSMIQLQAQVTKLQSLPEQRWNTVVTTAIACAVTTFLTACMSYFLIGGGL